MTQVKSSSYSGELGGYPEAAAGYPGLHHLAAHHASSSPDPWQYAAQVMYRLTLHCITSQNITLR